MPNDMPLDSSAAAGSHPPGARQRIGAHGDTVLKRFLRTRRSAVATELAIIALPFFLLLLGTLEVSFDVYVQAALNGAVITTARQIANGQAQMQDATQGGSAFVTSYMCPNVGGLLECKNIQVNIQKNLTGNFWSNTAPPYITGLGTSGTLETTSWNVCTGGPSTPVLFQAVYVGPTFVGGLAHTFVVKYNGALVHPTYSVDAFVNQGFPTVTVSC